MSCEIVATPTFTKDTKKLFKKYKSIKKDILGLITQLEQDSNCGTNLGNNLFKIRVKNSAVGGKRGGYRVVYYKKINLNKIYLLTIYSKKQTENIDMKNFKNIIQNIDNS